MIPAYVSTPAVWPDSGTWCLDHCLDVQGMGLCPSKVRSGTSSTIFTL